MIYGGDNKDDIMEFPPPLFLSFGVNIHSA